MNFARNIVILIGALLCSLWALLIQPGFEYPVTVHLIMFWGFGWLPIICITLLFLRFLKQLSNGEQIGKLSPFWMSVASSIVLVILASILIFQDWNADTLTYHLERAKIPEEAIRGIVSDHKRGVVKTVMSVVVSIALMNLFWLFYFRLEKKI
jgi:hypothetical protein